MLEFDYPWLFFLLPIPLLVWWFVPPYKEQRDAIRTPFFEELEQLEPQEFETLSYRPKRALFHWPLGSTTILILGYHGLLALVSRLKREEHRDG